MADLDIEPEIPEGINHSKTHPLADFGLMLVGALAFVLALVGLAHVLASFLVVYIPFEIEETLVETLHINELYESNDEYVEQTLALQELADRLSAHMNLPEGMVIHAHYDPSDIPNAFATLAGNIVIYQGLIDKVSSENGLAMVVAHEIAHIKHRDPIMSLGRGAVTLISIAALSGFGDSSVIANIAGFTGAGALSQFSQNQESRADEDAVAAVLAEYGTLAGADEFFTQMLEEFGDSGSLEFAFFSTHPPTDERIEHLQVAPNTSNQDLELILVPLPEVLLGETNATED